MTNYTPFKPSKGMSMEMMQHLHVSLMGMLDGGNQATVALVYTREDAMSEPYFDIVPIVLNEAQAFIETRYSVDFSKRVNEIANAIKMYGPSPEGVFQNETRILGLTGVAEQMQRGVIQLAFEVKKTDDFMIFNVHVETTANFAGHALNHVNNFILDVYHFPKL